MMWVFERYSFRDAFHLIFLLPVRPLLLVRCGLADIQTETPAVKVDLVCALLQNLCNVPCVLELPEINVTPALLDGVTNQLGGAGLTLGANDGGLLLLAGFVDNESSTLGLLLCDLLGFDCGGKLGGEGEVLRMVRRWRGKTSWGGGLRLERHRPT
jgi:hypothetical protein